jgi:hypothetical protein
MAGATAPAVFVFGLGLAARAQEGQLEAPSRLCAATALLSYILWSRILDQFSHDPERHKGCQRKPGAPFEGSALTSISHPVLLEPFDQYSAPLKLVAINA